MLKESRTKLKQPEIVALCPTCGKVATAIKNLDSGTLTGRYLRQHICLCSVSLVDSIAPSGGKETAAWRRHSAMLSRTSFFDGHSQGGGEGGRHVFEPGTVIGGVYEVLSIIGWGGMGTVYKVKHQVLERVCAVKVLDNRLADANAWKRFQVEARAIGSLNHRALVNVYDLGVHEGKTPFFVMDLVDGVSLETLLFEGGPLFLDDVLKIFDEVLDCLAYTHKHGIIHRDVKPANIMVSVDTQGGIKVKLLDFGLAKLSVEALTGMDLDKRAPLKVAENKEKKEIVHQFLTSHDEVFGSPHYMSPEQCQGEVVDARSDIYSVGCSIFEALTGEVPFEGRNALETMLMHQEDPAPKLHEKAQRVPGQQVWPDALESIVARCLGKDPRDRYQNVAALKSDLASLNSSEALRAMAPGENVGKKKIVLLEFVIPDWNSYGIPGQLFLFSLALAACLSIFMIGYWSVTHLSLGTDVDKETSVPAAIKRQQPVSDLYSGAIAEEMEIANDFPGGAIYDDAALFSPGADGAVIVRPDDGAVVTSSYQHFAPPEVCDFDKRVDVILRPGPAIIASPEKILKMKGEQLTALDLGPMPVPEYVGGNRYEDKFSAIVDVLNKLPNIHSLRVASGQVTGSFAACLARLKYIRSLDLTDTPLSVDALVKLPYFAKLESLEVGLIDYPEQMGKFIKALKRCKKLNRLVLNRSRIYDCDLAEITAGGKIHTLAITDCNIEPYSGKFPELAKYARFPGVRTLYLEDLALSQADLKKVVQANSDLERLALVSLDPATNLNAENQAALRDFLERDAGLASIIISDRQKNYKGAYDRYSDHLRVPGPYQEVSAREEAE